MHKFQIVIVENGCHKVKYKCNGYKQMRKIMRTGRPVSEDPRAYKISARLTASELENFEAYARRQGLTNAEVIKRGIQLQIDAENKKMRGK